MIKVEGLSKAYLFQHRRKGFFGALQDLFLLQKSEKIALNDVGFTINTGEIVGCIGPNGAGKSTTIKILTGVLFPTSGQVTVNGRIPWKERKTHVKHIGVMFGSRGTLWQELPAIESYDLLASMYGVDHQQYRKDLDFLSEMLGIEPLLNRPVRELSLGQRVRCEIVSVLIHSPQVVFLDEPTIGLDVQVKQKIRELIKYYNRERNMTFIYTSHDLHEIEEICPRLIILNEGRVAYDGQTEFLKSKVASIRRIQIKSHQGNQIPLLTQYLEENQSKLGIYLLEKISEDTVALKFDSSGFNISVFLSLIGSKYDWIQDIVIEDSSIEDIIARVYDKSVDWKVG